MVRRTVGTVLGKTVAGAVKLRGKSSGQALPGLVVQHIVPGYLDSMLHQLPQGVVVITGTNGKTTTTKMVVEVLRSLHMRVLTNATGSNLTRGIISSVSQQATATGKLPFDMAVFELDEAYASQFTNAVKPSWVLALNASRDQLDRFGEVDMVAKLIAQTMLTATKGMVVNADDKRLSKISIESGKPVSYFGVASDLLRFFPRDDELVAVGGPVPILQAVDVPLAVELMSFAASDASYRIDGKQYDANLKVTGQHNFQNAAGALALLLKIAPGADPSLLVESISNVRPAFGRGQSYQLKDGSTLQLNLVKNPASFRQGLASYVQTDTQIMIAINDAVADSRDMSWLWDIDFSSLKNMNVAATSGRRAVDMALRLSYDDIEVELVEPDLESAVKTFAARQGDKIIFASYTAMLKLHTILNAGAGKTL